MSTVPIVFDGVLYPKDKSAESKPIPCVFTGNAWLAGLTAGLPLPVPPEQPTVPGEPPHPAFPIWGPPGTEWPGVPGYPPTAGHPLPIPPEPVDPENPEPIKNWEAKAAWTPVTGWIVVLVPTGDQNIPTPSQGHERRA
jgi:hypothetical protein